RRLCRSARPPGPGAGGAAHAVRARMAPRLARFRPAQPSRLYRPRHPARGGAGPLRRRLADAAAGGRDARAPPVEEALMLDTVITGGTAVLPSGAQPAAIRLA